MSRGRAGLLGASALLLIATNVPATAAKTAPAVAAKKAVPKPGGKAVARKPVAATVIAAKAPTRVAPQQAAIVRVLPAPPPPLAWQPVEADYRWIDDGFALLDTIGDAPPDFVFSHAGGDAWGWRVRTGHEVYAEPIGARDGRGGRLRYYYFEPGVAGPFLIQDDAMAFGFAGAEMAVAYDRDGRVMSPNERDPYWTLADLLHARGRAIRDAARNQDRWAAADAGWWAQEVATVIQIRLRLGNGRDRQPGWGRWRGRPGKLGERLDSERKARWAAGQRFHRWRQDGFRGPVPQFGEGIGRPVQGVRPPRQGWRPRPVQPGAGVPDAAVARPGRPWPGAGRPRNDRPEVAPGMTRPGRVPPFAGQTPIPPQPQAEPGRPRPGENGRVDGWQRPDGAGRPGAGQRGRGGRPGSGAVSPPVAGAPTTPLEATPGRPPRPPREEGAGRPPRAEETAPRPRMEAPPAGGATPPAPARPADGGRRDWTARPRESAAPETLQPRREPAPNAVREAPPAPRVEVAAPPPPPPPPSPPPPPPPPPVVVTPPPPPPPPPEPALRAEEKAIDVPQ